MIPFAALALINLVAHFIPFERAAWSLDDLARLLEQEGWSLRALLVEMRDLNYPLIVFYNLIAMVGGGHTLLRVLCIFLGSSLVTVFVYRLLQELLKDDVAAFFGALLYNLLPNKLVFYQTLDYAYINLGMALYLLSFLLFLLFLKRERVGFLGGSVACYAVANFWYLLGFFLPVVLLVYTLLFYPRKARAVLIFLVPAAAYVIWRSNPFGISSGHPYSLQLHQTPANLFEMVPNLYAGRQMAKAVLYGLYRFTAAPFHWLILWIVMDAGILYGLWRWLQGRRIPPVGGKTAVLAFLAFIPLLAPALLTWGVMDRHTALSSVMFSILLLWGISRWKMFQRALMVALIGAGLVISQGTGWSQVVAGRINRAIFETLQERKEEILNADRVLIDQHSFSQQIPYTWVKDPNNQLDTYWGVQALLGRGNPLLVHWAVRKKKEVIVVRSPLELSAEQIRFKIYNPDTYLLQEASVPRKGSVLIDYEKVYPAGFHQGNRR